MSQYYLLLNTTNNYNEPWFNMKHYNLFQNPIETITISTMNHRIHGSLAIEPSTAPVAIGHSLRDLDVAADRDLEELRVSQPSKRD